MKAKEKLMSKLGFFWVVSDSKEQQQLLKWSITLAKRHYPELPRCVATSDRAFSCDADMIRFDAVREPHHESIYNLYMSPFDKTYYLCNRSMIMSRFDHLLSDATFESAKHFYEEGDKDTNIEDSSILVYDNHTIKYLHLWLIAQDRDWLPGLPRHILHEWRKHYPDYYVNDKLLISSESNKRHFTKLYNLQSRTELCGIPLPLWFRFPIFDLAKDYDTFYEMVIRDDSCFQ